MGYAVKSLFYTLQGEGAHAGRPAMFIRFAGCNLWSGRERDRATAVCRFCDTEFVGGRKYYNADALADAAATLWPIGYPHRMVVLTGGEPLLQVDAELIACLRARSFYVAVETNGTRPLPAHVDWLCVSPKAGASLVLHDADELKLVYPQPGAEPANFADFSSVHRWLSPINLPRRLQSNTRSAIEFCLANPPWKLTMQHHKVWGLQ